jgi:selenocysteine-specific translation elongation factor
MADNSGLQLKMNVDVEDALKGLKAVQRELKETIKLHREFENKTSSPYNVGDKVYVFWAARIREGIVVDTEVNYNNALSFTEYACEKGCIIRFEGEHKETSNGYNLGSHEVIPYREIRGLVK